MSQHVIKNAIISVSDKTGIVEFAKALNQLNVTIYSTGGTASLLAKEGIAVRSVSDITSFPEILDGRVKTLHPKIHGGLLGRLDLPEHVQQMTEHAIESIDMVVVNLYPFEETLAKNSPHEDIIENIDIGGPSMLRSAAKNYEWTVPVVNPARYSEIIDQLNSQNCTISDDLRIALAGEVFSHTGNYDAKIAEYFNKINKVSLPDKFAVPLRVDQKLRYGENPHQSARLYGDFNKIFKQLHGKELSYNNIIDIDGASKLILEFDAPTLAIIKHTNPCGVASANNMKEAFTMALATDNVSAFGGIICANKAIDREAAEAMHPMFTELIIAPSFADDALELLTKKKDRRLITVNYDELRKAISFDIKSVAGGYLVQMTDTKLIDNEVLKVVTRREPTDEEFMSMMFGWKVAKHVKSNAIVYAKSDRSIGIGAGQMSRVDSARIAVEKAKMMGLDMAGSACCSDAFFPFADGIEQAVAAGATAVIQPGGSVRDEDVIKAADDNNIAMIFTGMRHFRH